MSKITKEMLLATSLPNRFLEKQGKSLKIVLSRDEVKEKLQRVSTVTVIQLKDFLLDEDHEGWWFYTDDYCFGNGVTWGDDPVSHFTSVPSSTGIPHSVKERPGLETGRITNLEEFEFVYQTRGTYIPTIEKLLELLNGEDGGAISGTK